DTSYTAYTPPPLSSSLFFFLNHPPPPCIYTLSLHDALPIFTRDDVPVAKPDPAGVRAAAAALGLADPWLVGDHPKDIEAGRAARSEEHTSELQSRGHLVCRLLLEKKKKKEHMI